MFRNLLSRAGTAALASLLAFAIAAPAHAAQSSICIPTTGTLSGLVAMQDANAALAALLSSNSGASAPANDCSAAAVKGQIWLDTSTGLLKQFDGTNWLPIALVDGTNHVWTPPIGGGTATLASAGTTDLGSVSQAAVTITGTTTITQLGNASLVPGTLKVVKFSGALTLTYDATKLILPSGANITTVAGDYALVLALTNTNVAVIDYMHADGTPVSATSIFAGAIFFNGTIAPTALAANTNNWAPTGLAAANVIRVTTSASTGLNITGLTAPATNGQRIVIANDNAAGAAACASGANCPITLTANDANSIAANRFCFARPYVVTPQKSVTIVYGSSGAGFTAGCWRLEQSFEAPAIAGGFKNAKLTNGASPNNQLIYTADELTVEDVNGAAVRLSAVSCTADITVSGAGGLDTGAVAQNQGYHFWVIFNPTTNTKSCLFSIQSALGSITFPTGYTHAARVGWDFVENVGTKRLNRILCFGRRCQYVVTASSATASMPLIASGIAGTFSTNTPTWAAASIVGLVPPTASTIYLIPIDRWGNNGLSNMYAAPNNSYAGTVTINPPPCTLNVGAGQDLAFACSFVLESTNVYWASSAGGGAIMASGWEDNL